MDTTNTIWNGSQRNVKVFDSEKAPRTSYLFVCVAEYA